MDDVEIG